MSVKVAINGFGRIGRLVLRALHESGRKEIAVVAINDLGPVKTNVHLLKHDSVHGPFPGKIDSGPDWMDIGRGKIKVTAERDPAKLPWRELGDWIGTRAQAGRLAPKGFPRSNRFGPAFG